MKKFSISVLMLVAFILLSVNSVFAQEEKPKQTLWYVNEYVVKPSQSDAYFSLMKDFVNHVAENEFEYTWYLWRDHRFHYYSFMRVKDYNEVNVINQKLAPIVKSWGDEKLKKWHETLDHKKEYFMRESQEHKYLPEIPRLKSEERQFGIFEIYDIAPANVEEFSQGIKRYLALLKKNNSANYIKFVRNDIGMKDPQFIFIGYGKSKDDFWKENKKMWQTIGEEGRAIYSEALKLMEKRELVELFKLDGLSYTTKKQ